MPGEPRDQPRAHSISIDSSDSLFGPSRRQPAADGNECCKSKSLQKYLDSAGDGRIVGPTATEEIGMRLAFITGLMIVSMLTTPRGARAQSDCGSLPSKPEHVWQEVCGVVKGPYILDNAGQGDRGGQRQSMVCNSYCTISAFVKSGYCNIAIVSPAVAAAVRLAPGSRLLFAGCSGALTPLLPAANQPRELEMRTGRERFLSLLRRQGE